MGTDFVMVENLFHGHPPRIDRAIKRIAVRSPTTSA